MAAASTKIISAWIESNDFAKRFWSGRAEKWAEELPPSEARHQLAEELRQALHAARPEESACGVWGQLTAWSLDHVDWDGLATQWLNATRQGAIWSRLSPSEETHTAR